MTEYLNEKKKKKGKKKPSSVRSPKPHNGITATCICDPLSVQYYSASSPFGGESICKIINKTMACSNVLETALLWVVEIGRWPAALVDRSPKMLTSGSFWVVVVVVVVIVINKKDRSSFIRACSFPRFAGQAAIDP